jgi:ABC-type branched-subunit amino acid transport system ATPase component
MGLLTVEGVTKNFGALSAVRNVSFELERGEVLGLIGPNGAGKTTLFNVIAGGYKPDAGTIMFEGKKISGKRPHQVCCAGIARTYQHVKPFLNQTAFENVLVSALFNDIYGKSAAEVAEWAIALTELQPLRDRMAGALSTIDRRRIELARAIATQPRLVLLDEPLAGLNREEVAQFVSMVKKMQDSGVTILIIEHVMYALMGISTRIIVLDHGEKVTSGTPQEISRDPKVIEVYLGTDNDAQTL